MAKLTKFLQAAAGVGGAGLDITDVFSTYLYTGTGQDGLVITNGIDLEGEGGLIWIKRRNAGTEHLWQDSERGPGTGTSYKQLFSNLTSVQNTTTNEGVTSFNSNGFTVDNGGDINSVTNPYASWTFRKAPKFFDMVTYTGTASVQNISHNLGSVPGMIIVKRLDSSSFNWQIYHRNSNATPEDYRLEFTTGAAQLNTGVWGGTAPTDTHFTVGVNGDSNGSGGSLVAYLFAHNNGDGEFGPDADQDIIKCGSYTGNGSSSGNFVDLGFEPQFVIIKNASSAADWVMFDNMRGVVTGGSAADDKYLFPNGNNSEGGGIPIDFNATGFTVFDTSARTNANTNTFIYMAIRRGPLAQPESGTEVFDIDTRTGSLPSYVSTFPVDMAIRKLTNVATNWNIGTRLTGTEELETNTTVAAGSDNDFAWDYMEGYGDDGNAASSDLYSWMWKRAPGFFDSVVYSGNSTNNRELKHNLNVIPEMVWFKARNNVKNWHVYTAATGNTITGTLNEATLFEDASAGMASSPTASSIFLKNSNENNGTGLTYIAYLFATVAGVSKVGSYTGNSTGNASGITQTIDCGFTSGARFVLIKKTNGTGSWVVFDTARGIIAGNDPYLELNTTAAQSTGTDAIDPHSSGFTLTSSTLFNGNGDTFIFYAIA